MIYLPCIHQEAIKKQAVAEYPYECCGMLLGSLGVDKHKKVEVILPISNARNARERHNRFLITPEEMKRGETVARQNKLDVLGFYHSHPDHPAAPSTYDLEHAWPYYSYIIVAVADGKAEDLTSWELRDDRSQFNPEAVIEGD